MLRLKPLLLLLEGVSWQKTTSFCSA